MWFMKAISMPLRYVVNIKPSFSYYCEMNWNNYILSHLGHNGLFKCYKGMKPLVEWAWMVVSKLLYLGHSSCALGVGPNIDVNLIDMDVYYLHVDIIIIRWENWPLLKY